MNKTGIEYLDYTWNPMAMLCDPVSEGCQNCWHIKRAKMLAKNPNIPEFAQDCYSGDLSPRIITSRLDGPCHVKKPSKIGVQFMGDLFHNDIKKDCRYSIFGMMAICGRHTFMVLTKRPDKAAQFAEDLYTSALIEGSAQLHWYNLTGETGHEAWMAYQWPLDNVWFGISAETQKRYDERWTIASQIPAAVKFVSIEPALEYVSIDHFPPWPDWVIWGPETGPGKRPFKTWWAEETHELCQLKGIPFFDKRPEYLAREFPK